MPAVKKPPHDRKPHYLRAWRKYREISQEDAADRGGISRSNLSKIENGEVPYGQDLIERMAAVYGCEVSDLIGRDPTAQPRIPIFDLPSGDAERVYDFIRALRVTRIGDDGKLSAEIAPPAKSPLSPRSKRETS